MVFTWVDAIALGILAVMFIRGWSAGFVVMAGNLVSLVLGVGITAYLFTWISGWAGVANWHIAHPVLALVIFLLALGIVVKLLHLLVKLLNAMFKVVSIIPFVGMINSALGAALGAIEGVIMLAVIIWLLENIVLSAGWLGNAAPLTSSITMNLISQLNSIILPVMPIWI